MHQKNTAHLIYVFFLFFGSAYSADIDTEPAVKRSTDDLQVYICWEHVLLTLSKWTVRNSDLSCTLYSYTRGTPP